MVKRILVGLVMAACTLGASAANVLPTVSISNPAANASYPAPGVITLKANALDTDGTISKVAYYNGTTLIGEAVTAPYAYMWGGVPINVYNVTAKATDNLGGVTTSAAVRIEVKANVPPTVTFTAPVNNAAFAVPGVIALKSTATDSDGTVAKVTYFNGASAIGYASVAPYAVTWSNVAAGSYTITAKATDNKGIVGPAASVNVVVNPAAGAAQVFYIYADQINTAREITNAAGVKVWQADPEPFGANLPNENPAGQGQFTYNPRFPGQYYDRETGLHYNYYRDYDPQTGRYVQSDPIGLGGGINTYGYALGNPISYTDPSGLFVPPPSVATWAGTAAGTGTVVAGVGVAVAGGVGVGIGLGFNAGWEYLAGQPLGGSIYDFLNPQMSEKQDRKARKASHDAYKAYQRVGYERDTDACQELKNRILYLERLIRDRKTHDFNHPNPGWPDGKRHADVNALDQANVDRLRKRLKDECDDTC